jgi:hypothetical protein
VTWTEVFLGVIAVATLAIAVAHVVVLVAAGLLARRLTRAIDHIEREVQPILDHVHTITAEAARAAALASQQVERADRLFADLARRIELAVDTLQASVVAPLREGKALAAAFRAGLRAVLDLAQARSRRTRSEDEDALFI